MRVCVSVRVLFVHFLVYYSTSTLENYFISNTV